MFIICSNTKADQNLMFEQKFHLLVLVGEQIEDGCAPFFLNSTQQSGSVYRYNDLIRKSDNYINYSIRQGSGGLKFCAVSFLNFESFCYFNSYYNYPIGKNFKYVNYVHFLF